MQLKTLLGAALLLLAGATQAQTIPETTPEPEFIGEIVTVRPDGTVAKLEKQSVQMRTRANASAVIFGIGKAKTKLIIEGPKAGVRLTAGQPASFIVRAVDNATDPMSIINVEHVAHVEHPRHVGRRNDDRIGFARIGFGVEQSVPLPVVVPFLLDLLRSVFVGNLHIG